MISIEAGRNVRTIILILSMAAVLAVFGGCSERDLDDLEPATAPVNPVVFSDAFEGGLDFAAFEYSYLEAFSIDEANTYAGSASLRVDIPAGEEWAAGAFFTQGPRDMSGFNALTLYARASRNYTITALGYGNGFSHPSDYQAEVQGIPITTAWQQITLPIPNSARMTEEHGMFWFSALSGGTPVTIWFDEVEYANVATISDPRPVMPTREVQALEGGTFSIPGTRTTFNVNGEDMLVLHTMNHFDYFSDDPDVVATDGNLITGVSLGEATITAKLGDVDVAGEVTAKVVVDITQPYVFLDALDTGLDYGSFGDGQYLQALSVDNTGGGDGSAALRITVPAGEFAGGAIYSSVGGRDLSSFNALVFDARSDQASYTVSNVGFGIGLSAGGTDYQTELTDLELGTDWERVVVPIPDASRLVSEAGMFWFSTGQQGSVWFDNIRFVNLDESQLSNPRPVMSGSTVYANIGDSVNVTGTSTTYDVGGTDVTVMHGPLYYDYMSSNLDVAVASAGVITAVGLGQATISATLDGVAVESPITVNVVDDIVPFFVFLDGFDAGLDYGSFGDGQYLEALSVDDDGGIDGSAALQITVPSGQFAGGAVYATDGGRDLSEYNALVFDARSDQASYTVGNIGFGIGLSAGGTDYQTEITDLVLGTDWEQVVVPIPDAARLVSEAGMFWYSTGQTGNIWFDNIRFASLDESQLSNPRPVMANASVTVNIDDTVDITGTSTTFDVGGTDVNVLHGPLYYDYESSDTDVAVAAAGVVTAVGGGTATITATLATTPVTGQVTVTVTAPPEPPTEPAPTPTHDPADVISIYSDAYDDITVDTWRASWTFGGIAVSDEVLGGDNVKLYTGFTNPAFYCGIEFTNDLIDAASAGMTHFHMDIYAPGGTMMGFKLVDFGDNGVFGADDTEFQFEFDGDSTPPLVTGEWMSLDIPLTDFVGMNFGHVAQLVLTRINTGALWLDNIYFYSDQ